MNRPRASSLAAVAAVICFAACSAGDPNLAVGAGDPSTSADAPIADNAAATEPQFGSISLGLSAQSGVEIDSFKYVITGARFSRAGEIDVWHSRTVSSVIGGIPVANDYSLTLSGASSATPRLECTGSGSFAITAGNVTNLPIPINCHEQGVVTPSPVPLPLSTSFLLCLIILIAGASLARASGRGSESGFGSDPRR